MARSTSPADVEAAVPVPAAAPVDDAKLVKEEELDDDDCDSLDTWAPEKQAAYWESASPAGSCCQTSARSSADSLLPLADKWGLIGRFMAFATVRGCEARGIQPASLEVRPSPPFAPSAGRSLTIGCLCSPHRTASPSPGSRT